MNPNWKNQSDKQSILAAFIANVVAVKSSRACEYESMGGGGPSPGAMPRDDQDLESLKANKIPLAFRDKCGHLLVDLNNCRRATYFSPMKCTHERHIYEECEYILWQRRCDAKKEQMAAAKMTSS